MWSPSILRAWAAIMHELTPSSIHTVQVKTLDGRLVWRRRHYRVRRAKQPGTFNFSVLDNGVISKEYWR